MNKKPKIGIISLGCPRNMVDSELMLGRLNLNGYTITEELDGADVGIINTCGFIEDAKREAIDIILQAAGMKRQGDLKKIIVTGCLGQRYAKDLRKDIPEIDAILGIDSYNHIEDAVSSVLRDKPFYRPGRKNVLYTHKDPRLLITPSHYAYIKIAEGCRNRCSYCAIYKIRGPFRSREMRSVINEVNRLTQKRHLSELNIIAQDTTSYGIDRYGKLRLPLILKKIARARRARWIRILYTHPKHFSDELIHTIADEPSICKYIDLPIQHISDRILRRMNRKIDRKSIEGLIKKIRKNIPDVALRTSIIVGFPGETEGEFKELMHFIKDTKLERLGGFIYSKEEDTPAYRFRPQISEEIKKRRLDRLMSLQQQIAGEVNAGFMDKEVDVLIDEIDTKCEGRYIGRTQYDAPEVDGQVYVESGRRLRPGHFVRVKISDTLEYDLVGKVLSYESTK